MRTPRFGRRRLCSHSRNCVLRVSTSESMTSFLGREISTLQEQLLSSEATVRSLQAAVDQKDQMIQQLQPQADLLQNITCWRPSLARLLAALEDAERLGPLRASNQGQLLPSGPGPPMGNSTEEEDQEDQQPAVLGTTV